MSTVPATTAAQFDAVAPTYRQAVDASVRFSGRDLEFFTRAKVEQLIKLATMLLGDLRRSRMLDVGCGNGTTDALLAPAVGELHGVDVSSEMVATASEQNPCGRYRVYDGTTLPYAAATFDAVFAICVLHHVHPSAWDHFARELLRVTRPGGVAFVFEHNPVNPLTRKAVRDCPFDVDAVLLRQRTVADLFARAGGFVAIRRYILFTPWEHRLVRQCERLVQRLPIGAQYVVAARHPESGLRLRPTAG